MSARGMLVTQVCRFLDSCGNMRVATSALIKECRVRT